MDDNPKCPKCGAPMVKRPASRGAHAGSYFYGCSRYPQCRGTINIPQENRGYKDLSKLNFPVQLKARPRADGFQCDFIDSVAVPQSVLTNASKDSNFRKAIAEKAKWRIDFTPPNYIEFRDNVKVAISVLEKIINRGCVTRLSESLEKKIIALFNEDKVSNNQVLKSLDYTIAPLVPQEWHDGYKNPSLDFMTAEEFFYKKIFLDIAGVQNAKDILPQVLFESLLLDRKNVSKSALSQRVDFAITHKDNFLIVELDDSTHDGHEQKDDTRDNILSQNGAEIIRVLSRHLNSDEPDIIRLKKRLNDIYRGENNNDSTIAPSVTAIKIAHQFQLLLIKLLRYGKITPAKRTKIFFDPANVPSLNKDSITKILSLALDDLRELSAAISSLYHLEDNLLVGIELDDEEPDLIISVNDNYNYAQDKLIYIQDISYPLPLMQQPLPCHSFERPEADRKLISYLLKYIFRFDGFRPNQIDGILRSIAGEDSIVLLPTGSGKSVIYQLLSFILPGIIIVIDPLVSLINDQIDNLQRHGIDRAIGISGSTLNKEKINDALSAGHYILSFISPERLQIESFRETLRSFCGWNILPVCAIDEAHCVSEWGHDFRTSYLNLAETCREILHTEMGAPVIIALTGTASEAVLRDMEHDLSIDDSKVIRPASFDRKELEFIVRTTSSNNKKKELTKILTEDIPQKFHTDKDTFYSIEGDDTNAGIVFCQHVNGSFGTDTIRDNIKELDIPSEEYSGTPPKSFKKEEEWEDAKSGTARRFKDNRFPVLAATKSFGMGIDKPNIRFTIHYGLPQSIESYYQEAGRAGRDRKKAYSYIIASNDYPERNRQLLDISTPIEKLIELQKDFGQKNKSDDISRILYFHLNTFKGMYKEREEAYGVLKLLGDLSKGKTTIISADNSSRARIEKSIYRLSILGIVSDYTINFSTDEIKVETRAFDRKEVAKSYGKYVRSYQDDDNYVKSAKARIESIETPNDTEFIVRALSILLHDFVYEIVESSRRQALANLLEIVDSASQISDESLRSKKVRQEILKYLGNTHVDVIKQIAESPDDLYSVLDLLQNMKPKQRTGFYAETNRMLEAYPQHPALLLARTQALALSDDDNITPLASSLKAVLRYGSELYRIDDNILAKTTAIVINTVNNRSHSEALDLFSIINDDDSLPLQIRDKVIDLMPEDFRYVALMNRLNKALDVNYFRR